MVVPLNTVGRTGFEPVIGETGTRYPLTGLHCLPSPSLMLQDLPIEPWCRHILGLMLAIFMKRTSM
jgi:hypothetical protein